MPPRTLSMVLWPAVGLAAPAAPPAVVSGASARPEKFSPQHCTVASVLSPHECKLPAARRRCFANCEGSANVLSGDAKIALWRELIRSDGVSSDPLVSVIMGSESDWETMRCASDVLADFGVAHECRVVSAHRTPDLMGEYAAAAESRGLRVIIAGAGGAAHLPGMVASHTLVPVVGVPVKSRALSGIDSLLSIVQMPAGVPVATMAIGQAGATNAGLYAVAMLATQDSELADRLRSRRSDQAARIGSIELE